MKTIIKYTRHLMGKIRKADLKFLLKKVIQICSIYLDNPVLTEEQS